MYGPGDVRVEEREAAEIVEPTDAVIRVSAACVCGSDLWPYRGMAEMQWPAPMGHEYAGVVEDVGPESMNQALRATRPGGHLGFVGVGHGVALDGMDHEISDAE